MSVTDFNAYQVPHDVHKFTAVTSVVRIEGLLVLGVAKPTLINGAGDGGRGTTTGSTSC